MAWKWQWNGMEMVWHGNGMEMAWNSVRFLARTVHLKDTGRPRRKTLPHNFGRIKSKFFKLKNHWNMKLHR